LCLLISFSGYTYIGYIVKLENGSSYNEGRVEVYYNSHWGTVCDDGWDDTDAGVVCRQLGFGSSGIAIGSARFGQGSGSIWLDNVMCTGNESTLVSCGHLGVGVTRNCAHFEDAGVRCSGTQGVAMYMCTYVNFMEIKTTLGVKKCKANQKQQSN